MDAADQAEAKMLCHQVQSGHNLQQRTGIIHIFGPVGCNQKVLSCQKVQPVQNIAGSDLPVIMLDYFMNRISG
ncbi:hypothetical protein D3C74_401450 [compost metagenome]